MPFSVSMAEGVSDTNQRASQMHAKTCHTGQHVAKSLKNTW